MTNPIRKERQPTWTPPAPASTSESKAPDASAAPSQRDQANGRSTPGPQTSAIDEVTRDPGDQVADRAIQEALRATSPHPPRHSVHSVPNVDDLMVAGASLGDLIHHSEALLEDMVRQGGLQAASEFVDRVRGEVYGSKYGGSAPDAGVPEELVSEPDAIHAKTDAKFVALAQVEAALKTLVGRANRVVSDFVSRAVALTEGSLSVAEARAKDAISRYGLGSEHLTSPEGFEMDLPTMASGPEANDLAGAAQEMARLAGQERAAVDKFLLKHRLKAEAVRQWTETSLKTSSMEDLKLPDEAQQELDTMRADYQKQQEALIHAHPMLAAYRTDIEALRTIAQGPSPQTARLIRQATSKVLDAVDTIRKAIEQEPETILRFAAPVEAARQQARIADGSVEDRLTRDAVQHQHDMKAMTDKVLAGAGLVFTVATSLVTGAAATVATGLLVAFDALTMQRNVNDYLLLKAATESDFDINRSLSDQKPSAVGLVLDGLVMAGDVGALAGPLLRGSHLLSPPVPSSMPSPVSSSMPAFASPSAFDRFGAKVVDMGDAVSWPQRLSLALTFGSSGVDAFAEEASAPQVHALLDGQDHPTTQATEQGAKAAVDPASIESAPQTREPPSVFGPQAIERLRFGPKY
ncbi:MAG: hypothetical protein IPK13_01300 [Deltaproteobacteria bacterium]|nr:hypothetical protein [Deltaproteobacteria bacterium]